MNMVKISVRTTQHGFALEIDNKGWLLENEQQLAEAVVFRIGLECQQEVSKHRMNKLLNMLAYGDREKMKRTIREQGKKKVKR